MWEEVLGEASHWSHLGLALESPQACLASCLCSQFQKAWIPVLLESFLSCEGGGPP